MNRLIALLAILIALPAAAQTNSNPYTFKSSTLGMSLASFRERNAIHLYVPFSRADKKGKTTVEYRWITGPICNDQWFTAPVFEGDYRMPNILTCATTWDHPGASDAVVAGMHTNGILYRFFNEKLVGIEIQFDTATYPTIADAFEEKYGKPTDQTQQNYQNIFGARWAGRTKQWKNGDQLIIIAEGAGTGPGHDPFKEGGMAILEDTSGDKHSRPQVDF